MADRRMLQRDIYESSVMVALGANEHGLAAQRVFETLILAADDYGRGKYLPATIRAKAFGTVPDSYATVTPQMIDRWCRQIENEGALCIYRVGNDDYYQLTSWNKYQRGDWQRGKSELPPPPDSYLSNKGDDLTVKEQLDNSSVTVSDSGDEIEIEIEERNTTKRRGGKPPPSDKAKAFVGELFPKLKDKQVDAQAVVLDEIERIDGRRLEDVMPALRWARTDDFWSRNFLSCAGLRKRKNGAGDAMKYEKIEAAYRASKGKADPAAIDWDRPGRSNVFMCSCGCYFDVEGSLRDINDLAWYPCPNCRAKVQRSETPIDRKEYDGYIKTVEYTPPPPITAETIKTEGLLNDISGPEVCVRCRERRVKIGETICEQCKNKEADK